jgi:hypothetical protein
MTRDHRQQKKHRISVAAQANKVAESSPSTRDAAVVRPHETFAVVDNLATRVAISSRELDVIEAFLGAQLDELLK